jgi:hypothetical protein
MLIATISMVLVGLWLVGLWLIASSLKPRKSQPLEAISQSNSDQAENVRVP